MYKKQIDGLRGVLFLAVFIYHHTINAWLLTYALPCFFVLSGFLITRILLAGEGLPRWQFLKTFYIRRALRIFPIYYVVVAATWLAGILVFPLWHLGYAFNIRLFLLSLERDDPSRYYGVFRNWEHGQIHLWSMGIEEQFYLIFPLTLVFLHRRLRIPALATLIVGSIALRLWMSQSETYQLTLYGALLPICGEYILWGCLAAVLSHQGFNWGPKWLTLYGGVAMLCVLANVETPSLLTGFFQFVPSSSQTWFAIAITAIIIGLWNDDDALLSRFLRFPVLTFIGKMSYGLYLIHMAMWDLGDWVVVQLPILEGVSTIVLRFALCLILGTISWYAFELPINRLKKRFPAPKITH